MLHKVSMLEEVFGFNNTDSDAHSALREKELDCYIASLLPNPLSVMGDDARSTSELYIQEFIVSARESMKRTLEPFDVSNELAAKGSEWVSSQTWKRRK